MKSCVVFCCLLSFGVAVSISEKQIKLEDIERDMLQSERKAKDERHDRKLSQDITPPQPQYTTGVTQAILRNQVQPKVQYGFVPVRTPEHYVHPPAPEQQKYTQAYVQQPQYYAQQYATQQQYAPQQFHQPQYQEQQVEQHQQQQQPQYVQYENVPYVVDNSIGQNSQYYQPQQQQQQYIYLQPYSAASNNIHSVVDAKGNVQYVMYVPASYLSEKQLAEYENSVIPSYEQPQQQVEYQYVPESHAHKYATQAQYVPEPKHSSKYTKVQYAVPQIDENQISPPVFKKEPKSLLDSYVPSILQYQLYKQHQAAELKQRLQLGVSGRSYLPHDK